MPALVMAVEEMKNEADQEARDQRRLKRKERKHRHHKSTLTHLSSLVMILTIFSTSRPQEEAPLLVVVFIE